MKVVVLYYIIHSEYVAFNKWLVMW